MEITEDIYCCRNCKQEVAKHNYELHSLHCERKLMLCELCDKPVNINDFKLHCEEQHVMIHCPNCEGLLEKWTLPDHMESCPKRLVVCKYCESDFPFIKLEEHLDFCGSRTEKCFICQNYVMIKDKETHSRIHMSLQAKPHVKPDVIEEISQNYRNESINQTFISKKSDENKRYAICHICNQHIPWIDMNIHVPTCATNAGKCSACGEDVPAEKIKNHVLKQCPKQKNRAISKANASESGNNDNGIKYSCQENSEKKIEYEHGAEAAVASLATELQNSSNIKECPYCYQKCSKDRISDHIKSCPLNTYECPLCNKKMHRSEKGMHEGFYCLVLIGVNEERGAVRNSISFQEEKSKFEHENVVCQNCSSSMPNAVFEVHLRTCFKNYRKCKFCKTKFLADQMDNHLRNCQVILDHHKGKSRVTSYGGAVPKTRNTQMKQCRHCKTLYNSDVVMNHEEDCIHKPMKCEKCGKKVPLKDFGEHIDVHEKKSKEDEKHNEKDKQKPGFLKSMFNFISPRTGNSTEKQNHTSENQSHGSQFTDSNQNIYPNLITNIPFEEEESIPCEFCDKMFPLSQYEAMIIHSTECGADEIAKSNAVSSEVQSVTQPVVNKNATFFGETVTQVSNRESQSKNSSAVEAGEFLKYEKSVKSSSNEFIDACVPKKEIKSLWSVGSLCRDKGEEAFLSSFSDDDADKVVITKSSMPSMTKDDIPEAKHKKTHSKGKTKKTSLHQTTAIYEERITLPMLNKQQSVSLSSSEDELAKFTKFIDCENPDLKKKIESTENENVNLLKKCFVYKTSESSDMDLTPTFPSKLLILASKKESFNESPVRCSSNMELTPNSCNNELHESEKMNSIENMECDDALIEEFPESKRPVQSSILRKNAYEQYLNDVYHTKENQSEAASNNQLRYQTKGSEIKHSPRFHESLKFCNSKSRFLADSPELDPFIPQMDSFKSPEDISFQNTSAGTINKDVSSVPSISNTNVDINSQPDLLSTVDGAFLKSEPTFKIRTDSYGLYKDLRIIEIASKSPIIEGTKTNSKHSKLRYDPNRKTIGIETKKPVLFDLNKTRNSESVCQNTSLMSSNERNVKPGSKLSEGNLIDFGESDVFVVKSEMGSDTALPKEIINESEQQLVHHLADTDFIFKERNHTVEYEIISKLANLNINVKDCGDDKMCLKDQHNTQHVQTTFMSSKDNAESVQSSTSDMSVDPNILLMDERNDNLSKHEAFHCDTSNNSDPNSNEKFSEACFINKQKEFNRTKQTIEIDLTQQLLGLKTKEEENENAPSNSSQKTNENCNGQYENSRAYRMDTVQNGAFKIESANNDVETISSVKSVESIIEEMRLSLADAKKILYAGTSLQRRNESSDSE